MQMSSRIASCQWGSHKNRWGDHGDIFVQFFKNLEFAITNVICLLLYKNNKHKVQPVTKWPTYKLHAPQ